MNISANSFDENPYAFLGMDKICITNKKGNSILLTNYGARLVAVKIADKDSVMRDVVLGYSGAGEYVTDDAAMGAVCGRFANRIAKASFDLNEQTYYLNANDGENTLHGGKNGFAKKIWQYAIVSDNTVEFSLFSPDEDENFPGNLWVKVGYSFSEDDKITVSYSSRSDMDTYVNLTNHSYFNLNGDGEDVLDHELYINSDSFLPVDEHMIPTGEIRSVHSTPFDFSLPRKIGERINENDSQLLLSGGYDHCFMLKNTLPSAVLYSPETAIKLTVNTNMPAMQLYSANFLSNRVGKDNALYCPKGAVCLETQYPPDNMHHDNFVSSLLKKGEIFSHTTEFCFTVCERDKQS